MENAQIKELEQKWQPLLNEGDGITDRRIRVATAIMLENQEVHIKETTYSADLASFPKLAVPMVRRTFPVLLANQVVGVQPMTGPVGLAFALRYYPGDSHGAYTAGSTELGYNTIEGGYTGTGIGTENNVRGVHTSAGERLGDGGGTNFKTVNMKIEKSQVEARTRKVLSQWSLEEAQDLKNVHGMDMDSEMLDILSYEIVSETDRELIQRLRAQAYVGGTSSWDCSASDGRWEMERYMTLYNHIVKASNTVAISTRRGPANWAIVSPTTCSMLEALNGFIYNPNMSQVNELSTIPLIGTIDKRIKIYCDTFATTDFAMLGYKGISAFDSGIIYCPYISMLVKRVDQDATFQPRLMVMSRYAIHENLLGVSNYYRWVNVNPC